jgi:polyferredoxin
MWLTLRRLSQVFFLGLFVFLLVLPIGSGNSSYPLRVFLETDPLLAVLNALATHVLYPGLLWSLAILVPVLFLGRFFCGWICPLGTLHHWAGTIRTAWKSGRRRIDSNRYQPWQRTKYYLLLAILAAAVLGSAIGGMLDPISLVLRSIGLSVLPAAKDAIGHAGLPMGTQTNFRQSFVMGAILIALLALDLRITRFWCRALCPLGALLGLGSRWSIFGLEKRQGSCGDCHRCLLYCQGGDDPVPGIPWRRAECHLCLNCVGNCPEGALRFRFFPQSAARPDAPDLKRRKVLTGIAAGAAAVPLLRAGTSLAAEADARRIRPPAALDEEAFLARCVRCGACMDVCPNHALHPALSEGGWEGLWTPVLVPRLGYCEPDCIRCGQACPTGAIREFTAREKGWENAADAHPIRLGTAFYDRGRCLPWAMATDCIVCEEWCPLSPKAIYFQTAEVTDSAVATEQVRQPYLDPARCVGCGACEFACPVKSSPAIYVTSAGESRSKGNQMLLTPARQTADWLPATGAAAGWKKTGETRRFEAADLWQYVDGDAERYVRAGVLRALTANYRYGNGLEAAADIYLMESPAGSASIFEAEPSVGSRRVEVGDAGRGYGQSVTFRRAACFVRLVAYQDMPETESALLLLARAIDARLPSR